MQYIPIKKIEKDGKEVYVVQAIPLKNTKNSVVQKIPHPLGTESITFESLEQAKESILLSGFSYIMPDGQKGSKQEKLSPKTSTSLNYDKIVLNAISDKINSTNSTVAACAITALAEFPTQETFDILFNKIGEENEQIRKNAIAGICKYSNILSDRIIEALNSSNWVSRNSALTCIQNISDESNNDTEKYIIPVSEKCNDINPIIQANALITLSKIYKEYKKKK